MAINRTASNVGDGDGDGVQILGTLQLVVYIMLLLGEAPPFGGLDVYDPVETADNLQATLITSATAVSMAIISIGAVLTRMHRRYNHHLHLQLPSLC